jgi:hypothetical protein
MKKFLDRILPSAIALVIAFAGAFTSAHVIKIAMPSAVIGSDLYEIAIMDAVKAESDEIIPLVTIDEAVEEVLVVTFHRYPDSYPIGEEVTLEWGGVWTFTADEINKWYDHNNGGVTDWDLRLKQLIGLPAEKEYTHFTALWVSPDDIIRPAYVTDIYSAEMSTELSEDVEDSYREWFESNIVDSYFSQGNYPWTRLGYTYDWADTGSDYGLTEFLVSAGSKVRVEFTLTTNEFVTWLADIME